jgi:hypothetical protein
MKKDRYLDLPRDRLNTLFEFYLRKLQLVDGFWFLGVEERFGTKVAIEINSYVWAQVAKRDARRAKSILGVKGEGIPALIKALESTYMAFVDWDMVQVSDDHAIFRATTCFPQKARIEKGLGPFDCRASEEAFFTAYAKAINPRFEVKCEFCPPEKYSEDLWCEWHFYLKDETKSSQAMR